MIGDVTRMISGDWRPRRHKRAISTRWLGYKDRSTREIAFNNKEILDQNNNKEILDQNNNKEIP